MGGSAFFFIKSKSFEFSDDEGGSYFLLRIIERDCDSLCSIFLDRESAKHLLANIEVLISPQSVDTFLDQSERRKKPSYSNEIQTLMALSY